MLNFQIKYFFHWKQRAKCFQFVNNYLLILTFLFIYSQHDLDIKYLLL